MQMSVARPVEDCLIGVLQHLGLASVHVASAGSPALTDWFGIATRYPDRIASLTVIAPPIVDEYALGGVASRLLAIAGDHGVNTQGAIRLAQSLPGVSSHALCNYEYFPWTDVIADRGAEVGRALMDFIDRHPAPAAALPEIAVSCQTLAIVYAAAVRHWCCCHSRWRRRSGILCCRSSPNATVRSAWAAHCSEQSASWRRAAARTI